MSRGRTAACAAATMALAAAGVLLNRSADAPSRLVDDAGDWLLLLACSALAGAVILRRFVAPRRRNWLWPPLGGLLTGGAVMVLALLPDALSRIARGQAGVADTLLALLVGALYAMALAGPLFALGALLLHGLFRLLGPGADGAAKATDRDP